jgi:hypothetical protein
MRRIGFLRRFGLPNGDEYMKEHMFLKECTALAQTSHHNLEKVVPGAVSEFHNEPSDLHLPVP